MHSQITPRIDKAIEISFGMLRKNSMKEIFSFSIITVFKYSRKSFEFGSSKSNRSLWIKGYLGGCLCAF